MGEVFQNVIKFEDGSTLYGDFHKTRTICDAAKASEIANAFNGNPAKIASAVVENFPMKRLSSAVNAE